MSQGQQSTVRAQSTNGGGAAQDPSVRTTRRSSPTISVPRIIAGALAAASGAFASSWLGLAGTVTGAIFVSIIVSVGTAVYTPPVERSRDVIQRGSRIVLETLPVPAVNRGSTYVGNDLVETRVVPAEPSGPSHAAARARARRPRRPLRSSPLRPSPTRRRPQPRPSQSVAGWPGPTSHATGVASSRLRPSPWSPGSPCSPASSSRSVVRPSPSRGAAVAARHSGTWCPATPVIPPLVRRRRRRPRRQRRPRAQCPRRCRRRPCRRPARPRPRRHRPRRPRRPRRRRLRRRAGRPLEAAARRDRGEPTAADRADPPVRSCDGSPADGRRGAAD